jgi:HSP20 family molecular chaperone IbpA
MTQTNETREQSLQTRPAGDVERTREARVLTPPADILETEGAFELTLDLPGVDPASLDLTFENDVLTLRAKSRVPSPEGYALAHAEFELGDYHRAFEVGEHVDADGIEANLRHGVLTIRLPKAKAEARKVAVSTD